MSTIFLIAVLIIFCLIMLKIVSSLRQQQKHRQATNQQRIENLQSMLKQQYEHRVDSIHVIANAMDEGQCEYTEGCIRLKHLIGQINPDLLAQDKYRVIDTIYKATEHMPIKEDWKALDKKIQTKLSNERYALEAKHKEDIEVAVKSLRDYAFPAFGEQP